MSSVRTPSSLRWLLVPGVLLGSASGCVTSDGPGDDQVLGEAFVVQPVDPDFVLHQGERVSIERAMFDLREAVREADRRGEPRPLFRIELPPVTEIGSALSRLREGADLAGVDRIEIETADT